MLLPTSLNKWILSLFFFLSAFVQAEEKLFIPFDDRPWKIGYEAHSQGEEIIELVLQNENVDNWSELFTVQTFKGLPVTASEFITVLERSSRKNIPEKERLKMEVIEKDPLNILEQSFISSKKSNGISDDEYNIGRIIKGKTDLYYVRYSSKDPNVFKQNRDAWIKRFKLMYLAQNPVENQQGRWFTFTSKSVHDQGKLLNDSKSLLH